jgi:hypothetical protein
MYEDKWSLVFVSKHVVWIVFDDHVLSVNIIFDHQVWLFSFIRDLARSCCLIGCNIEVSFK